MAHGLRIARAVSGEQLDAVRALCWAYRDFLLKHAPVEAEITRTFYPQAKYRAVMDALPDLHARPRGVILLATLGDVPVGCGMTHALNDQDAEIKRLFVTPAARGRAVAHKLCTALIDQARADGFTRIVLDTSSGLSAAQALYTKLGFRARGPYQDVPKAVLPHLRFYERAL